MTRIEVKKKLDNLLESFNPKDCTIAHFMIDYNEYDLIVNTVWQLKSCVKEGDAIAPNQYLAKINSKDSRDKCIAKFLRTLLNEFGVLQFYLTNG